MEKKGYQPARQATKASGANQQQIFEAEDAFDVSLLSMDALLAALDADDERVIEAVTNSISGYAKQLAEALRAGKDYLDLLSPTEDTPAVHALAMSLVLESAEEELEDAD